MMIRSHILLCGMLVVTAGCGAPEIYNFAGHLMAEDSVGEEREHVIYWNRTDWQAGRDNAAGSIILLSECSTIAIPFDERDDGIIFRMRASDRRVIGSGGAECGRVRGFKRIDEISEGELQLTVACEPEVDEFNAGGSDRYLKARVEPYRFRVVRVKEVPKRPECRLLKSLKNRPKGEK